MARGREACMSLLWLLPPQPGWMDGWMERHRVLNKDALIDFFWCPQGGKWHKEGIILSHVREEVYKCCAVVARRSGSDGEIRLLEYHFWEKNLQQEPLWVQR